MQAGEDEPSTRCRDCGLEVPPDAPGGACPACLVAFASAATSRLPGPGRLGDYELLERLGEGTSALVFKARQFEPPRLVALKIIRSGQFASDAELARFRLEAAAAASLHHPNIVPVFSVGVLDGWPFLALKLIEGESLARRLHGAPGTPAAARPALPSVRDAVTLVAKVARAVHFAHQRGLLHRDLKPGNILIDAGGEPHLTDFGTAKWLDRDSQHPPTLGHLGTPQYMAPELVRGDGTPATVASDLYSLGVILYELIAGRVPFRGPTLEATFQAVLAGPPPRLLRAGSALDRDLETVCLKCLEKDPEQRHATAAALADELGRWLEHRPVLSRRPAPAERLRKWVRRNPVVAALTLLLAASVIGGLSVTTYQLRLSRSLLAEARTANARLSETLDYTRQREAELRFSEDRAARGIMALAPVLRQHPSNQPAATRLFAALTQVALPWPVLPPLRHDGAVVQGAFSPDSAILFTAAEDGWLRLWSRHSGVERLRLPHDARRGPFALSGPADRVVTFTPAGGLALWHLPEGGSAWTATCRPAAAAGPADPPPAFTRARFSADSATLVTSDECGRITVWSAASGHPLAEVSLGESATDAALSRDGQVLLGAGAHTVHLWRLSRPAPGADPAGVQVTELPTRFRLEFDTSLCCAELSPGGERLLTASGPHVEIWELASASRLLRFDHNAPVVEAHFSPDGQRVVASNGANRIQIYDLDDPRAAPGRYNLGAPVRCVGFSPNGDQVALGTEDGRGAVLSLTPRLGLRTEPCLHPSSVLATAMNSDNRRLLTLAGDATARLWALDRSLEQAEVVVPGITPTFCEFSPVGGWAAVRDGTGNLSLAALDRREPQPAPLPLLPGIVTTRFSPDGRWLAAADITGAHWLIRPDTGMARPLAGGGGSTAPALAWSANGRCLAATGPRGVAVWTEASGWSNAVAFLSVPGVRLLESAPDGGRLAIADDAARLRLWEPGGATNDLASLELTGVARQVRFSRDGRWVAVGAGVNAARVWDAASGRPITPVLHPGTDVTAVAFSPDGAAVLTGAQNGQLHLWRLADGKPLADFGQRTRAIVWAEFSPDGAWVLSQGEEGRLRLTHVASGLAGWTPGILAAGTSARFGAGAREILVSGPVPGAQRMVNPAVATPPADLLIVLAEIALGRRLTETGGWVDLDEAEWRNRFTRLTTTPGWTRMGPPPQVRVVR